MKCKLCQNEARYAKTATIRDRYNARYYSCGNCGFIFVDNPVWLKEAYEKPINVSDTGYVSRNIYLSKITLIIFTSIFGPNQEYVDYAGGYGILTRLMRDYGFDFLHYDPFTQNLFAQGFGYNGEKMEAMTCFECFEHLLSPIEEIEKMFGISKNILFSTRLLPTDIPDNDWEYYGFEHGQHISFYSLKTLEFLALHFHKHLCSDGKNIHLLTDKRIPNWLFKMLLFIRWLQIDILFRRLLKSKTASDSKRLSSINI